jgi:hypothetical protein
MLSQSKTALVAVVTFSVLYLYSLATQVFRQFSLNSFTAVSAAWLLISFIISLPLPLMLAEWYRSGTNVTLGNGLRRLALGTAVVYGVYCLAIPVVFGALIAAIQGSSRVGWAGATATAASPSYWHHKETVLAVLGTGLFYIYQLALLLFLIALVRRPDRARRRTGRHSEILRVLAIAATAAVSVSVILTAAQILNNSAQFAAGSRYGLIPVQLALRAAIGSVPELCRLMIPLIAWRSLAAESPDEASPINSQLPSAI